MPMLIVHTNVADNQISDQFIQELSVKATQALNKPEEYMAVQVSGGQRLIYGGTNEPAAIIDLAVIDLGKDQSGHFGKEIMTFFQEKLHIKPERMFIKFNTFAGNMLGWNKGTL